MKDGPGRSADLPDDPNTGFCLRDCKVLPSSEGGAEAEGCAERELPAW